MKKNDEMIMDSLRKEIEKNAENVQVPLRLQKESIVAMLKQEQENKDFSVETDKGQKSASKVKYIQRMAAMAAAMAIVIASALVMKANMPSAGIKLDSMALKGVSANKLREVSNNMELENTINEILNKNSSQSATAPSEDKTPQVTPSQPESSAQSNAAHTPSATPSVTGGYENLVLVKESAAGGVLGMSETIQKNAYQADIAKAAGDCLYVVSVVTDGETGQVYEEIKIIKKSAPEKMGVISTIRLTDPENLDFVDNCLEIHIKGELLIAVMNRTDNSNGSTSTLAAYYSVKNPEKPVKIREHMQDGVHVSSGIQSNGFCLVTDKTLEGIAVPSFSVDGAKTALEANEIKIAENPDTSYILITVTDISDFGKEVGRLAIVGCGKNISCFGESVVVAREFVSANADENGNKPVKTEICRFNTNGTSIAGAQLVDGKLAGGISADEESGYLKAVTVDNGISNIYVFDEEMQIVSANSFSTDGEVKATKFIGDNGYIVLDKNGKEQTVVIDFSNPEKPEGAGMVETDGFGDSFCMITDSLVLAIKSEEVFVEREIYVDGKNVDSDYASDYTGPQETVTVKSELVTFTLFDLSNPEKPVAADSYSFAKGGEIDFSLEDIEGVVVNSEEEIFGVPVRISDAETQSENSAYMIFDVSEKTLRNTMILKHGEDSVGSFASRGICTDSVFFTVSGNKIVAFSMKDGSVISGV